MADPTTGPGGPSSRPPLRSGPDTLERSLSGTLPCIGCGYELQGLSVRGQCPECGLLVRATILWRVDPHAEAFTPLTAPRLTALGIVLWPAATLGAAGFAWWPRIVEVTREVWGWGWSPAWAGAAVVIGAAASGIGALTLVRPTRDTKPSHMLAGVIGVCAYAPLLWLLHHLYTSVGARAPSPYLNSPPDAERVGVRLLIALCALVVMLGLRPNARRLVARSLVLRTGRVDRQTILASAGAVLLAAAGDGLRWAATLPRTPGGVAEVLDSIGTMGVLLGSMLMTGALAGAVIDSWRIRRAILSPSPSMRQVIGESPGPD